MTYNLNLCYNLHLDRQNLLTKKNLVVHWSNLSIMIVFFSFEIYLCLLIYSLAIRDL